MLVPHSIAIFFRVSVMFDLLLKVVRPLFAVVFCAWTYYLIFAAVSHLEGDYNAHIEVVDPHFVIRVTVGSIQ